jgi:hypothetical protein
LQVAFLGDLSCVLSTILGFRERLEKEFAVYLAASETSSEFQAKDMKFTKIPEYFLAYREKEAEATYLGSAIVGKVVLFA